MQHFLSFALAAAIAASAVVAVDAQEDAKAPQAAAKADAATADGHLDLSGFWAVGAGRGVRTGESSR